MPRSTFYEGAYNITCWLKGVGMTPYRTSSQVQGRMACDEKEKRERLVPVLRTAASQGSVRMWTAVVNDVLAPEQVGACFKTYICRC